jgi:hypothetical protein
MGVAAMIASAAASRSMAALSCPLGNPAVVARAVSTASGPSSMTLEDAAVPAARSRASVFCAMRSVSCRVDDGLPVPALTTTRCFGSASGGAWRSSRGVAVVMFGSSRELCVDWR